MISQSLSLLSARIKLRQRHLLEWDALVDSQQKVWALVREKTDQKMAACGTDTLACIELKKRQATQLIRIITHQRQAYAQMKARHQQEQLLLEQASGMSRHISSRDTNQSEVVC